MTAPLDLPALRVENAALRELANATLLAYIQERTALREALVTHGQHLDSCKRPKTCPAMKQSQGWCYYCTEHLGHAGPHQHERTEPWEEAVVICTCGFDAALARTESSQTSQPRRPSEQA